MPSSTLLTEGKTTLVYSMPDGLARFQEKDDATAGDGRRHEVLEGKAAVSTTANANHCKLLKACGFPIAFSYQDSPTSYVGPQLNMIKLEVVGRLIAAGSELERHPKLKAGFRFPKPLIQFFLKTNHRAWTHTTSMTRYLPLDEQVQVSRLLECDDPLIDFQPDGGAYLYHPHKPLIRGAYFTHFTASEIHLIPEAQALLSAMSSIALAILLTLEYTWKRVGALHSTNIELYDFKIEFGLSPQGILMVGDKINGDSCRILENGVHIDKQPFRNDEDLENSLAALSRSAFLSESFADVQDDVVAWVKKRFSPVTTSIPCLILD